MKRFLYFFLLAVMALGLAGCIKTYAPEDLQVTLNHGETQIFSAMSNAPGAELVWTLDGEPIGTGGSYTFAAQATDVEQTFTLVVKEQGEAIKFVDSVTWTITVLPGGDTDGDGYPSSSDCNDQDAMIHPGAEEICNGIDDNCNGIIDDGCYHALPHVRATDLGDDLAADESERTHVSVTWEAVQGATYYRIYRSPHVADGNYELVGDHISGTSFDYIQTWENDVRAVIGDMPALSPTADFGLSSGPYPERAAFMANLKTYHQAALPALVDFKAPAYFKVQACNQAGCSEMSDSDLGQAELLHTAEFSEAAQLAIQFWSYPALIALSDMPPASNGLTWCGLDLCGAGGGIARGRISFTGGYINLDQQYENYTEGLPNAPGFYFETSGRLGGSMEPAQASDGEFVLAGNFDLKTVGRPDTALDLFVHIGKYNGDGTRTNEGLATITYKGQAYQFTLPIQPLDGISGHAAAPPAPVVPMQNTRPMDWYSSEAIYPLPNPGWTHCNHVYNGYDYPFDYVSVCQPSDPRAFYRDADGDGAGDPNVSVLNTLVPDGYVADNHDCNDADPNIYPDKRETCNGLDDNCSGQADECCQDFYVDADRDGYGDSANMIHACYPPSSVGYALSGGDCNDQNASIHPGAQELSNGVDDDCDGLIDVDDPDCNLVRSFQDADGDGFGNPAVFVETCAVPPAGYVTDNSDCDDAHPAGAQVTYYPDEDGDGYGYGNTSITTTACDQPPGYADNNSDCDDTNAAIHPGIEEICDNSIDENCDGILFCSSQVTGVRATDLGDDLAPNPENRFHITVIWNPTKDMLYYKVYRSPFVADGAYELVGDHISGTSFDYVQTWENDVRAVIGDMPALSPTADFGVSTGSYPERAAFIATLKTYQQAALPVLFNFKAPAYFKVQACNEAGCGELSAPDLGQAELLHTADFSEAAQLAIHFWSYPALITVADAPPGVNGLAWCGLDLCGAGGGIARGRVQASGYVNVDLQYENYTEVPAGVPEFYFVTDGRLGGSMEPAQGAAGEFMLAGHFDLKTVGRPDTALDLFVHIGKDNGDGSRTNEGLATIAYKGQAYQFTLPIQPLDGISGHAAAPPSPVDPMQSTRPDDWYPSEASYPLPPIKTSICLHVSTVDTIPICPSEP